MEEAVNAIVFNTSQTEVLAMKRRDMPIWVLPGGKVDENESPEDAVIREVLEETGLQVAILRKVGTYTPVSLSKTISHVYECRVQAGSCTPSEEAKEVGFFAITTLPKVFFLLHEIWIQEALLNSQTPFQRELTELNWRSVVKFVCSHPYIFITYLYRKVW